MENSDSRQLPPLQLEDRIALLRVLVIMAWVAAAGTIVTEVWVKVFSPLEWPTLGDFPLVYRALSAEFILTTVLLTVLLVRRDWYERVPRSSAGRVRWLLGAVIAWLGLHLGWAFHVTGGLQGPVLALIPLMVLAALLALPGREGWWAAAYVFGVSMTALLLERQDAIQSPGPLTPAFIFVGDDATPLGAATLMFGFLFAAVLAAALRHRTASTSLTFGNSVGLDPTTGLFNRDFLTKRLLGEIARERRYGGNSTLLLIGLEGLADGSGDVRAADERLKGVSQHLLRAVRLFSDTPTRYGLTTLAVLLPTASHESVHSVVQRIVDALQTHEPGLRTRYGAALISEPSATLADQVMEAAERALRAASPGAGPVVVEAHER